MMPRILIKDGYLQGLEIMFETAGGDLYKWASGTNAAKHVRQNSGQGRTPILRLYIGAHSGGGIEVGNLRGKKLFSADDLFKVATEKNNRNNTFKSAYQQIGPPRCWFTRNADVYGIGCHTTSFARDWAARILRTSAHAHGISHFLHCVFANRVEGGRMGQVTCYFSSTLDPPTPINDERATTIAELLKLSEGWVKIPGEE
jgi:hypothetical protein